MLVEVEPKPYESPRENHARQKSLAEAIEDQKQVSKSYNLSLQGNVGGK